jgi:hypothetical protein
MVHPVDPHHFVRAASTVSGRLAEVFAKDSKLKGFEDIVPTSLHTYADVFSETAFDSLPERHKWDHTIELECEPSPGFCKGTSVHILTLSPLLSPINSYSTLCICTSTPTPVPTPIVDDYHHQRSMTTISDSRGPLHIKVIDSRLLPPFAPQPHQTSIGYMGTCPRDTTAPSASCGLMVRRGLEAWCCIGHYVNVLGPSQGSSEHSLWIPPD